MIRSSKHTIKFTNKNKLNEYNNILKEYRRIAQIYTNFLWQTRILYKTKIKVNNEIIKTIKQFSIKKRKFELPKFIATAWINKKLNLQTFLTQRMLKCCLDQVIGIIKSVTEKQSKRQYIANKLRSQGKKISRKLRKRLRKFSCPNVSNSNPEISSNCCNFKESDKFFNFFVRLKSYTNKQYGKKINIPLKYTKVCRKWQNKGKRLNSILLTNTNIQVRYEIINEYKENGSTVGADEGQNTVIQLSNTNKTPHKCKHGHTCASIVDKLNKKKRGSKAFRKAKEHFKNFIGWSVNQLNLVEIKQVNLEGIKNLKIFKKAYRLTHWCYPLIISKMQRFCEEQKVSVKLQSPTYRSQRCSSCGLVLKSNRKGKEYCCKNCGLIIDADLNAALNHQHSLPDVPAWLRKLKLNKTGFYWLEAGFFSLTGEAFIVPCSRN